jgi:hypothetical protein
MMPSTTQSAYPRTGIGPICQSPRAGLGMNAAGMFCDVTVTAVIVTANPAPATGRTWLTATALRGAGRPHVPRYRSGAAVGGIATGSTVAPAR